jgi:hypothetical protein
MAVFPSVTPTSMDFTAPEFPVKTNSSLSGVVSRRIFGNRGSRATLSMNFDNLTDSVAVEFLNSWKDAKGSFDSLTVPSIVFSGAGATLSAYLAQGGDSLVWHFAEPPQLQRVSPGVSSVRVSLEATRDF